MKLIDEDRMSEINDKETYDMIKGILSGPTGKAASWIGPYRPTTKNSDYDKYAYWNRSHYDIYLKLIEMEMDEPGDVLEIGSASGARSVLLARYGNRVTGIDLFADRIEFAKKYNSHPDVTYLLGKFPDDVPANKKYDYIFCISVIYQNNANGLNSDAGANIVNRAVSLLKPGGKLFVYDGDDTLANLCSSWKLVKEYDGGKSYMVQNDW